LLTLYTEDSTFVGSHTVYLWCELNDYPSVKAYSQVPVTINPCVLANKRFTSVIADQAYFVGDDRVYYTYTYEQTPCDYTQAYSVELATGDGKLPAFIDYSTT